MRRHVRDLGAGSAPDFRSGRPGSGSPARRTPEAGHGGPRRAARSRSGPGRIGSRAEPGRPFREPQAQRFGGCLSPGTPASAEAATGGSGGLGDRRSLLSLARRAVRGPRRRHRGRGRPAATAPPARIGAETLGESSNRDAVSGSDVEPVSTSAAETSRAHRRAGRGPWLRRTGRGRSPPPPRRPWGTESCAGEHMPGSRR